MLHDLIPAVPIGAAGRPLTFCIGQVRTVPREGGERHGFGDSIVGVPIFTAEIENPLDYFVEHS